MCGEDVVSGLPLVGLLSLDDRDDSASSKAALSGDKEGNFAPAQALMVGADGDSMSVSCGGPVWGEDGPLELLSCSPRPNKSVCFQREPPEGCEKVPVCEETM